MSHDRPARAAGAAWRLVEGEMIVVSAKTADILSLNQTGAFVWEKLDGSIGVEEIAASLAGAFDVDPELAGRDVREFVGELAAEGLLEPDGEASMG